MRVLGAIVMACVSVSAQAQTAEWLVDVPDGTVLAPGESITVTMSVAFDGAGEEFAAFGVTIFSTLNEGGADLGGVEGWEVLNDLDFFQEDVTTTDGDSLYGTNAGQLLDLGPFVFDNPIDVFRFTWTADAGMSGEVSYETLTPVMVLFVGPDINEAEPTAHVVVTEASFGWSVLGCGADVNGDGVLNVLDFVAFQLAWQAQEPIADCDGNGAFDVLDFVCFQLLFVEGCP